jgi:hypothetical protein
VAPVNRVQGWAAAAIALVVGWIVQRVWPALSIPWWFNTDELALYSETLRQLRLDPSQTFFDIPGTPYTVLVSVLTGAWWFVELLVRRDALPTPSDFAISRVQEVHALMRGLTLGLYVVAVFLTYAVVRRAAGAVTGAVAAVLMATLPIHVHYSHFARTESLGLVLALSAVWLISHPRWRGQWTAYLAAGVLAGVATAARYQFAIVTLGILAALYWHDDRPSLDLEGKATPRRALYAAAAAVGGISVAGGTITLLLWCHMVPPSALTDLMLLTTPDGSNEYPDAKRLIAGLWLILGTMSGGAFTLLAIPASHQRLRPVVNPYTASLGLGFTAGFLGAHPAFLWRGEHQLRSIQFYSNWREVALQDLDALRSWSHVTVYYFDTAFPEPWLKLLFVLGLLLIVRHRSQFQFAFLIAALTCFVGHPLHMKLWPHHVIPWLPFLCFVAAYPVGYAVSAIVHRVHRLGLAVPVVLGIGAVLAWSLCTRLARTDEYLTLSTARTTQIAAMTRWIADHVSPDEYLALSYFALNRDGFWKWAEHAGVLLPPQVDRRRAVDIWWLDRRSLAGRDGYVCVSRADIAFFREDAERRNPGSTYDPFKDEGFEPVALFGSGFYELQVFRFDFRARPVGMMCPVDALTGCVAGDPVDEQLLGSAHGWYMAGQRFREPEPHFALATATIAPADTTGRDVPASQRRHEHPRSPDAS